MGRPAIRCKVRLLKDTTSVETFAFDGLMYIPMCRVFDSAERTLTFSVRSGTCEIESLEIHGLQSAWR